VRGNDDTPQAGGVKRLFNIERAKAMDDLKKRRDKKRKNAVVEVLLKIPGATAFGPYVVLYNKKDGIQLLLLKDEGIVNLFSHKP
jgi:hypothetical protein